MAQSDSPNTDLSNGAIVHSPVGVCPDLDTQRGGEDEHRKEEDDEVELAEEVGEDVLMMAGDGEEDGENTEQNEPGEGVSIQMLPQSNGVQSEENRGVENLKENCEEEEQLGDKDRQKIDEETSEDKGGSKAEEESNDRHTMIGNSCDLLTVINEKQQEQLLDKCEDSTLDREDEGDKQDVTESLETDVRDGRVCEENGGGENLKETSAGEEEPDDDDIHNIDEEINHEDSESQEESNDRHTIIENQCDLKRVLDREGQEHLLCNNNKHTELEANKQDVAEILETQIREETIGEDVFKQQELVSCIDDAEHVQGPTEVQQLLERTGLSVSDTYEEEIVHIEGDGAEICEPPLTVVTSDTSEMNKQLDEEDNASDGGPPFDTAVELADNQICQITNESELTDENDNSSKQHVEFLDYSEKCVIDVAGKEIIKDATPDLDDVLDAESGQNKETEQPLLNVVCSEEQSQMEITGEETPSSVINEIFQEEKLQSGKCQMVKEKQTEEGDTSDDVVRESLCEEEKRDDDHKEVEQENKFEDEAHMELPDPVLQHVEEGPSDRQQAAAMDQSREAFELEKAGKGELSSPGIEDPFKEKRCTAGEKSELQDNPLTTQSDEGMELKGNMMEQLKEEAFPKESKGEDTDALMAEMDMANEPVTVLDDEFDEPDEAPHTELGEQTPASLTANSIVETTEVEVHRDEENKDTGHQERNEETHNAGKEEIQANEKPRDDERDFQSGFTDRVKELKQAMECGMLNVDPQPPKKEDWRSGRVPPHRRRDDDWIKKEPEDVKEPETQDWRKELKPVRKDIWEPEMGHKETSPEKKSLLKKEDWIKELKSVFKDESLPKKRDDHVKKKRVVLWEDGHSYFPQWEDRDENRQEVTLISHKKMDSPSPPVQDSSESQDQAYEISLYVKVKMINQEKNCMFCLYKPSKSTFMGIIVGIEMLHED